MNSATIYLAQGYRPGAPDPRAEEIDAAIVRRHKCPRCGSDLRYEAWTDPNGSYIAMMVCTNPKCGWEREF